MELNQVGALEGKNRKSNDQNKANSGTGTSKGNEMVVGEGKEENKSKVKRMTVLRAFFPSWNCRVCFPRGTASSRTWMATGTTQLSLSVSCYKN